MRRLPALILALAGLACGGRPARAEEPEAVAEVRRLIAADTPASLAWAAFTAAERGATGAGEDLVLALLRVLEGVGGAEQGPWVRAALLDALTRLRARVPDDLVLALAEEGRDDLAVHLLDVQPTAAPLLLSVYDAWDGPGEEGSAAWLALGNHLAAGGANGFAARVLRRATLVRRVEVRPSHEREASTALPPPRGTVPGCGVLRPPEGFPPVPVVRLWVESGPGRRLLAAGSTGVWVSREVLRPGDELGVSASLVPHVARVPARWSWIAGWLPAGLAEGLLPLEGQQTLPWTGRRPFERAVQPTVDAVHRQHADLLRALVAAGRLTPAEARALLPDLRVEVVDARYDARHRLPPVPPTRIPHPFALRPRPSRSA